MLQQQWSSADVCFAQVFIPSSSTILLWTLTTEYVMRWDGHDFGHFGQSLNFIFYIFYCCSADPNTCNVPYTFDSPCPRMAAMFGPVLRPGGTRKGTPEALRCNMVQLPFPRRGFATPTYKTNPNHPCRNLVRVPTAQPSRVVGFLAHPCVLC